MKLPIPEFLNKLKEDFLSGKKFDLPEEDYEHDFDDEGVSQEELEALPVYRALHEAVTDGIGLDELIDAFAAMCKLPLGEDDLLFETGNFNFTGKKLFYFSLVRQFQYKSGDEFVQLHLDIRYAPNRLPNTTEWNSLTDGDFFAMVRSSAAYQAVKDQPIAEVAVYIDET